MNIKLQTFRRNPSLNAAVVMVVSGGMWLFVPAELLWAFFDAIMPISPEMAKWGPFILGMGLYVHYVVGRQIGRVSRVNGYARRMQYFVRSLIEHCPLPLMVSNEHGNTILANRPALLGDELSDPREIGKTIFDLFPASTMDRLAANDRLVMKSGIAVEDDVEYTIDGNAHTARIVKFPILDERSAAKGTGTFSIDLTYSKLIERKLKRNDVVDGLTGLPNREYISRELPNLIERASGANQTLTVMLVEFEGLKKIEAAYGHSVADDALIEAIKRLTEIVGPTATLAYLRGWDVLVIYPESPGSRRPESVARAISTGFAVPMAVGEHMVFPGPRIGLAAYPRDGATADALLKNVRAALSDWSGDTTSSFSLCVPDMEKSVKRRLAIETHLRTALERGEFLLNYQPQLDARGEHIIGAEALIRWRNPVMGFVSPAEFIPIAEETGLISEIDRWVLETACREAQTWTSIGGGNVRIAVNVTANQFQSQEFVCFVSKVLRETGLSPRRLEIELTERIILKGGSEVHENLKWLSKLNVNLAIDDFGTGYSSLKTLKSFPFNVVKIDKSFVDDIVPEGGDLTIVKTIVGMAKTLRLDTVAEGVETEFQRDVLRSLEVDCLQGYFYSRPVSAFEIKQFIRRHMPSVEKCG